jgi:hypothetical protein
VSDSAEEPQVDPRRRPLGPTTLSLRAHLAWLHVLVGAVTAYLTIAAVRVDRHAMTAADEALATGVALAAGLAWTVWLVVLCWTLHATSTVVEQDEPAPVDWYDTSGAP